jgi:hypothetical protein
MKQFQEYEKRLLSSGEGNKNILQNEILLLMLLNDNF